MPSSVEFPEDAPSWARQSVSVACVGLSALDYMWLVERLPEAGSAKVRAIEFSTKGGGMAATAAVAVARLGGRAMFVGRGGEDPEGHWMRDAMAATGVDVTHFRLFAEARSSVSGIFVDRQGERQISNFRGLNQPTDPSWLPLSEITACGAVLADPRWIEGAVAAFSAARAAGVPTVLDADMADKEVFETLLPLTDHAIFSAPALAVFAETEGDEALAFLKSFGCKVAAVTRGADGIAWIADGGLGRRPAYRVEVVDTTGAGDVFHGAYAFALAAGAPLDEVIDFASAAAALKCTKPDGRSGIPSLIETLRFWRTHS
ncbi:PfkB family carbohydrate kinase [Consotaella salsifontis]|uniref:Sulfofructose kinase n=1 Tax=Consotaella salsifontis TaxID=1365950 RepID=A0A1T4N3W1_9HYPH|nr:PfkB family carbohydrate kinase [Consotaella salsifontis]SJZ73705.1 sulfofructose kinase [Consotaella salsifontis]